MNRPVPAKRILPSKEAILFKDLLNLYESRQLKKALKTADQILKKFPEHGGMHQFIARLPLIVL
jgi:hypothetical protein